MRRAVQFVFRNWPLKLAAIVLASLLYAGLVVSQNVSTWPGRIPIDARLIPENAVLLTPNLGEVTNVRFFAPPEIVNTISQSSFTASVDLSTVEVQTGAPTTRVAVNVVASDRRVQILGYEPQVIQVRLDPLSTRTVPVKIGGTDAPIGLEVGTPQLSVTEVRATGPDSVVRLIAAAQARVVIQPSALNIDGDYELRAVDARGEILTPVDFEPATVHIRMAVGTQLETKSLPVSPVVTGTPANGYEVDSVSVQPLIIPVEGDAATLESLSRIDTMPLSISGARADVVSRVQLDLPTGVNALDRTITVTVSLRAVTVTRSFEAGIVLAGARADRVYALSTDRVIVLLGGTESALDSISGSSFTVFVDVGDLDPGSHEATIRANLPAEVTLVTASPARIGVSVSLPATPEPIPSPSLPPSPAPSGSAPPGR